MKKMLWFTVQQNEVLKRLKTKLKMNNSEIIRAALRDFAVKYGVSIPDNYNASNIES